MIISFTKISARANDDYGHSEFGTLSADATPHNFNVGGIKYNMPANYIQGYAKHPAAEVQSLVIMPVVYPGVKPFEDDTKYCFAEKQLDRRMPDCYLLQVFIEPAQPASSDPDVFNRLKKVAFGSRPPEAGPYGYELYSGSGGRLYRKQISSDLMIGISCIGFLPGWEDAAVCDSSAHTKGGGRITLRFDPANLYRADQMMLDVLKFVDDHTVTKQ